MIGAMLLAAMCAAAAPQTPSGFPPPSLRAAAEPLAATVQQGEAVLVRLTIGNSLPPCRPAYVDPILTSWPDGDRPFTVVHASLVDERGKAVSLENRVPILFAPIRPGELTELGCGEFFGKILEIGPTPSLRSLWSGRLPPGRYTLRLAVTLGVRTFFVEHPELAAAEAERHAFSPDLLFEVLADQVLETEPVAFSVVASAK